MSTTLSKPVSVSMENMTPEPPRSERTICCTPTDSATFRWSKPFVVAVADRPVGEQRGEAAPAGIEQRRLAADVEEGLLLAGEARVRQVLGRRARPDGDIGIVPAHLAAQVAVGGADRFCGFFRPVGTSEGMADALARLLQRLLPVVEVGQRRTNDFGEPVRLDKAPVGAGGGREAGRHLDAFGGQSPQHLAERGVLAADPRHVADSDIDQPDGLRFPFRHRRFPSMRTHHRASA